MLVIFSHAGYDGFRLRACVPLGSTGVALFLILSAYGLTESYKKNGLQSFWKKRVFRVLVPYSIWIVSYATIAALTMEESICIDDLRYWFVEYIILWYAVYWLSMKYAYKHRWACFGITALALFVCMPHLQAQQSLSFIAGIAISENNDKVNYTNNRALIKFGGFSLLMGVFLFLAKQVVIIVSTGSVEEALSPMSEDDESLVRNFLQLLPKLPIALSIIAFSMLLKIGSIKTLLSVGVVSYELYLVSMPFFRYIEGSVTTMLLCLAAAALGAFLLYKLESVLFAKVPR